MPFVKSTVLEQKKREIYELKTRGDELRKTALYLKTFIRNNDKDINIAPTHIRDKTGLKGQIDKFTSAAAPGAVSGKEGFVIFGMNGHGNRGHAVALYHGRDELVRFFDPNLGEAFFGDQDSFRGFLSDLCVIAPTRTAWVS